MLKTIVQKKNFFFSSQKTPFAEWQQNKNGMEELKILQHPTQGN